MSKRANYQGKDVEVQEVEVLTSHEPWGEYQLANGKVLMIKTILIEVDQALTEKTQDGEPLYLTKTHQLVRVK